MKIFLLLHGQISSVFFVSLMLYLLAHCPQSKNGKAERPSKKLHGNMSLKLSIGKRHCCFLFSQRPRSRGRVSPSWILGGGQPTVLGVLPAALTSLSGLLIHTGQLPQLWLSMVLNCYFLLTNQTDGQHESRG